MLESLDFTHPRFAAASGLCRLHGAVVAPVSDGPSGPASATQEADPPPGSAAVARTAAWAAATRATGMRKGEQET
jgi:hypothetical protein